jgi:ABC-type branched-subunit amino acid transport system ATPase component
LIGAVFDKIIEINENNSVVILIVEQKVKDAWGKMPLREGRRS